MILLFLACVAQDPKPPPATDAPTTTATPTTLVPLPAPRLLRRVSLDLTGTLPGADALDAVEADPSAWTQWRDLWMNDPRYAEQLVVLLGERWYTRIDDFQVDHTDFGYSDSQEYAYERAIGEEPLRLIASIAAADGQWSEVVTAENTVANGVLADIWPLDCPEGTTDWQSCRYTDGRPAAGVLATNGLWWRYTTTQANLNRGRVAAILRLLVCEDIFRSPVSFADLPSLLDAEAAAEAIRTEPACAACHAEIEPVAASLMGFYWSTAYSRIEQSSYHPERELLWRTTLEAEPAWYGTPIAGLVELGPTIAADPRFAPCAVESFAELYWRRPVTEADAPRLAAVTAGWNGQIKALGRALMDTPEYQAGEDSSGDDSSGAGTSGTGTSGTGSSDHVLIRLLSPQQLGEALEQLTGFHWTWEGYDQMDNDAYGYRVLAGGVDGEVATRPQSRPGLTWALVVKRLAEAAAANVVAVDLSTGVGRLLDEVTVSSVPTDAAFQSQIRSLGWRLYAERLSDDEVAAWGALWSEMAAASDPTTAWTGVLSAMFRDMRMVSY